MRNVYYTQKYIRYNYKIISLPPAVCYLYSMNFEISIHTWFLNRVFTFFPSYFTGIFSASVVLFFWCDVIFCLVKLCAL